MNHHTNHASANPQLTDYITENRRAGADDTSIREALLQAGWPLDAVERAFKSLHHDVSRQAPQPSRPAAKKYKLFTALIDGWRAIRANLKGFLYVLLVNMALSTAVVVACIILAVIVVIAAGFSMNSASPIPVGAIIALIFAVLLFVAAYLAVYAFMLASFAIAITDGAEGRTSDITTVIKKSFKAIPRIILAELVMVVVLILPLFALFVVMVSAGFMLGPASAAADVAGGISVILTCLFILGALAASIALTLVPMVAIFEPHVKLMNIFMRSIRMLRPYGFWFVIKWILLLLAIQLPFLPFMDFSTGYSDDASLDVAGLILSILWIPVSIFSISTLVMLYRNRAALQQ